MSEPALVESNAYQVAVRRETLRAWELTGTAYSVQLAGETDERWLAALRALRAESIGFGRFHLDSTSMMVVFACRAGDGPGDIGSVLDLLDSLVELTNLYASGADNGLDRPVDSVIGDR
jgi:hypothetical protein